MKLLILKLLPRDFKDQLKLKIESAKIVLLTIFASTSFLSSLYYLLFSRQFYREHQSVLKGRLNYYKNNKFGELNKSLLRRNVHRLEKGMIMKPRKSVYAKRYIEDTVDAYLSLANNSLETNDPELTWAYDVLYEYFSIVGSDENVDKAKTKFESCTLNIEKSNKIPFVRELDEDIIDFDTLYRFIKRRRSVRWFEQKKVPRELIDNAIMLAAQSPSACNRQPFCFKIFDDPEMIEKVSKIPGGTAGFYHNFKSIVVVVGELDSYFNERDRHVIYVDASIASMSFLYGLEVQGLSSCIINWPDVESREVEMANLLGLESYQRVVMLIAVGWPDKQEKVPFSEKKSIDDLRTYN